MAEDNIEVKPIKQFTIDDFSDFLDDLAPEKGNDKQNGDIPVPSSTLQTETAENNAPIPDNTTKEQLNINSVDSVKEPSKKRARRKRCKECDILYPPDKINNPDIHACIKKINETENPEPESEEKQIVQEKKNPRYKAEMASKNLYNLQFTAYYMVESALKSADRDDMDGLTSQMEEMREQYLHVFEQIYEEHGSEYLDEVLSPVVLWGMLTTQNVASTYISNKKKKSEEK